MAKYKYYDMDAVIASALDMCGAGACIKKELLDITNDKILLYFGVKAKEKYKGILCIEWQ